MLQIRHPKARELARRIAARDGISMTDAVVRALEKDAAEPPSGRPSLVDDLRRIQDELRAMSKPGGYMMTKEDIDDMWGHPPDEKG
jgi:antitoxin VapB